MAWFHHAASVCGPGHIQDGLPNQDAVLIRRWRYSWLVVVSDGMGSRPRAKEGSYHGCRAVVEAVRQCSFGCSDKTLIETLYRCWLQRLGTVLPNDAVATVLIAWGHVDGRIRLLQLGDGVVLYPLGTGYAEMTSEGNRFSNETTGLGISRRYSDWQCHQLVITEPGQGVALMTDGISDDLEQLETFVPWLITQLHHKGLRYSRRWLCRALEAWPTPGHSDDKTLALIYRM